MSTLDLATLPDSVFTEMYDAAINHYEHRKDEIGKRAAADECRPWLTPFSEEGERRADAAIVRMEEYTPTCRTVLAGGRMSECSGCAGCA